MKGQKMRHLRIKPTETDTIMHVYNRISGSSGYFPFGNPEKEQFLRRLRKLNEYYVPVFSGLLQINSLQELKIELQSLPTSVQLNQGNRRKI